MAVRYVKEALQSEIAAALATSPASAQISTVLKSNTLDRAEYEQLNPDDFPAVLIEMPVLESQQSVDDVLSECYFTSMLTIFNSRQDLETADTDMSKYFSVITTSLNAYASTVLRRLGHCQNTVQLTDEGWWDVAGIGQDQCYRIQARFHLWPPTSLQFDDGS